MPREHHRSHDQATDCRESKAALVGTYEQDWQSVDKTDGIRFTRSCATGESSHRILDEGVLMQMTATSRQALGGQHG
jgi:hypothetical protein